MIFWLVIILGLEPGPHFGVVESYKSLRDCEQDLKQMTDDIKPKMRCIGVVFAPVKEL